MPGAELHFLVKTDLVLGGRMHTPSEVRVDADGGLSQLADLQPGAVSGFFLAAWLGSGSKQFSLCPIGPDGVSEVRVSVAEGDVDTLKLAVTFNMVAPKGTRNCHLASSFIPISDLSDFLSSPNPKCPAAGAQVGSRARLALSPGPAASKPPVFSTDLACFGMSDNFTRNSAVLRFVDAGSNLAALGRLRLRPSALRSLDRTNNAVFQLGKGLKEQISRFAVSPLNAGPQYMEAFTYGQMQGLMTHYSLLGHAFSCMPTPVDLPWVMYNAYQTVQSTGLTPRALSAMSDTDLVTRFGIPLISRHTSCALSTIYCTDYTVNAVGQTCKLRETEDIAQTYSCLSLLTQPGLAFAKPYVPAPARLTTSQECVAGLTEAQRFRRKNGLSQRKSIAGIVDDCENETLGILMQADGIRKVYSETLLGSCPSTPDSVEALARRLAPLMSRCAAQTNPHLFAKLTQAHHDALAPVIVRLGRLLHTGAWSNCLAVVSAKGASYDAQNPAAAASSLSGHGTVISRVKDHANGGTCLHCPIEGTTYLSVSRDPPPGLAASFTIRLVDGTCKVFDHAELATVIAQNVHEYVGMSCDCCMLSHIRSDYGDDTSKCPFYVSAFYTGLSEGSQGSLGCVPLDTSPPASFGAGSRPLFGAPVIGLSRPSTVAVPVTAEMLGQSADDHREVLGLIRAQVSEAWSPEVDPKTVATIASFWQPCEAPDHPGVCFGNPADAARCIRSENTWAFDRPEHTAMAVQLYRELAETFNALQAKDPASDGSRAHAFGQFLSATLRIILPIPRAGQQNQQKPLSLSCMRNLRAAAATIGVAKLAACPLKAAGISARAKVPSEAHFYMCDRGSGPVHAHRAKLA
jgi:hypothetical protein